MKKIAEKNADTRTNCLPFFSFVCCIHEDGSIQGKKHKESFENKRTKAAESGHYKIDNDLYRGFKNQISQNIGNKSTRRKIVLQRTDIISGVIVNICHRDFKSTEQETCNDKKSLSYFHKQDFEHYFVQLGARTESQKKSQFELMISGYIARKARGIGLVIDAFSGKGHHTINLAKENNLVISMDPKLANIAKSIDINEHNKFIQNIEYVTANFLDSTRLKSDLVFMEIESNLKVDILRKLIKNALRCSNNIVILTERNQSIEDMAQAFRDNMSDTKAIYSIQAEHLLCNKVPMKLAIYHGTISSFRAMDERSFLIRRLTKKSNNEIETAIITNRLLKIIPVGIICQITGDIEKEHQRYCDRDILEIFKEKLEERHLVGAELLEEIFDTASLRSADKLKVLSLDYYPKLGTYSKIKRNSSVTDLDEQKEEPKDISREIISSLESSIEYSLSLISPRSSNDSSLQMEIKIEPSTLEKAKQNIRTIFTSFQDEDIRKRYSFNKFIKSFE